MVRENQQRRPEHAGNVKRKCRCIVIVIIIVIHNTQSKMYNTCDSPVLLVFLLERRCGLLIADRRNLLPRSLERVPKVLVLEARVRDRLLQVLDDSES